MEKIVKKALLKHLESNGLLTEKQHGFVPNRSCVTNMLIFMDSLTEAHDNGHISDVVFFDFAKAFDKVPHRPLLQKLVAYGIDGQILKWISSFLLGRSFQVRVGSVLSDPHSISSGVPQGSVLGPILFLIYVNDLPEVLFSPSLLYADDLKVWTSCDASALQIDLDAIQRWSTDWSLPINPQKCRHMSFGGDSANTFILNDRQYVTVIERDNLKTDLGEWLST